jgi:hypothetical protein
MPTTGEAPRLQQQVVARVSTTTDVLPKQPESMGQSPTQDETFWSLEPRPLTDGPQHSSNGSIDGVASGQKLIIFAILVNLATFGVTAGLGDKGEIFILGLEIAAITLALLGVVRVALGLGYSTRARVVLLFLAFIPILNFWMLVLLNARATRALRAAGYKVGLLGAR